jgi:riboflavin kinase/FMN adenylyltransferase
LKIHHTLERGDGRPLVVAIGFFDGLHRGHREIVRALLRLRKPGYHAAILTFENHPKAFLNPGRSPDLITTLEERVNLLAQTGIDEAYVIPFDERISSLEAAAFLEEIIADRLRASALVFGENFRFGNGRRGDARIAREVLSARGVGVSVVPSLMEGGLRISSTRIREAIAAGETEAADALLGGSYALRGRVRLGHGRGHDLGFPTANLETPPAKAVPRDGVYAAVARYDGADTQGLVSIGTNPTFSGAARTVEVWLRDFNRSIYGEELTVRQFRFIREQRAFSTAEELIRQMQDDATHVRFPSFSVR